MFKRFIVSLALMGLFAGSLSAAEFPETFLEISPELSYGVHDNGPAWIELVPLRGGWQATKQTAVKAGFSYAYEIDRDKKPFGTPNHYGWRISARLEHAFVPSSDMRFFYEVNVGEKVDGSRNEINYLQTMNYQRFGLVWRLWKVI
ncbi:MAG: hypothetical protein AB7F28_00370 [Candidatus Margulisiibacteriota bacterium]